MITPRLLATSAAALGLSISLAYAGPCAHEIDRVQARVDTKLEALAGAGPAAVEGHAALLHRQPTPGSLETAEVGLDDVSSARAAAIRGGMAQARQADRAGDQSACEQALAEVQRTIDQ